MSYRYDRKKKHKRYTYIFILIVMFSVIFTPVPSWIFTLIERPLAVGWERSSKNIEETKQFFSRFYGVGLLQEEHQRLQERVDILEIDLLRTQYLESVLSAEQEFKALSNEEDPLITGNIIAYYPRSFVETITINRGSEQGVRVHDTVISREGVFLGYVDEVANHVSRASLATSEKTSTQAVLFSTRESLELNGDGIGYQAQVARESEVAVGDVVYHQEEPGRVIGIVRDIVFDPRDPFKVIYVGVPLNIKHIQTVGIQNTQV